MALSNPYQVIKQRHLTEKSKVLNELQKNDSNKSVKRCTSPKYVFIVAPTANKRQIAMALETIYKEKSIKVVAVNTINVKAKARRVRGRLTFRSAYKKAVVTLEQGDSLDEV